MTDGPVSAEDPPGPSGTCAPGGGSTRGPVALLLLAALKTGFHLLTRAGYGMHRDEFYYLACARHLDLGYVDLPPLSVWLLWLQTRLVGDTVEAVRILPALTGAATIFLTGWLARELGGGRAAQVLAAACAFASPVFLSIHHFYSPNALDVPFWIALCWLAARILRSGGAREWLAFGALAGLALLNKLQVGVLLLGIAAGMLLFARHRLASPWPWLGGAVAIALWAPQLYWQASHGWPTLEFAEGARSEKIQSTGLLGFLLGQIVLANPGTLPTWLCGLWTLLRRSAPTGYRALGCAYLVVFGVTFALGGKTTYVVPVYPLLFAAGAVALEAHFRERGRPRAMAAGTAGVAVATLLALPLAVPLLPVEQLAAIGRMLPIQGPRTEVYARGEIPDVLADMHGWEALADAVARVYARLPPEERRVAYVLTANHGEAAAIEYWARTKELPPAISGHNTYYLWGPRGYRGGPLVVLGGDAEQLRRWFDRVERVDTFDCRYCRPIERNLAIHVCRGLRIPLAEFWASLKHYV